MLATLALSALLAAIAVEPAPEDMAPKAPPSEPPQILTDPVDDADRPTADGSAPVEDAPFFDPDAEPEPMPVHPPDAPVKEAAHFVFANYYGLTAGVSPLPSFDQAFFFGHALASKGPGARRLALGYAFTLSLGGADRYTMALVTTRHHLVANFYGGRRQRLMLAVGGGFAAFAIVRPHVIEAEGRIGYLFGGRQLQRRGVGVLGLHARLGWDVRHREYAPMPQIGAFIGVLVR